MIHTWSAIAEGASAIKLTVPTTSSAARMPCSVKPAASGRHLMEDFCYAGGLPAVMKEIAAHLHLGYHPQLASSVGENIALAGRNAEDHQDKCTAPFQGQRRHRRCCAATLAPRGNSSSSRAQPRPR